MSSGGPYTGPLGEEMEIEIKMLLQAFASRAPSGERMPDLHIYECPRCGPIYLTHEKSADDDDRDSLVGAPRTPTPNVNSSAIAVSEPNEDDPTESR
jgi:hypothetical protein